MKISYNWLKEFINFNHPPAVVAEAITRLGLEVESVDAIGVMPNEMLVVGEVLTREKHPSADRLSVSTVNVGSGTPLQIVCGAQNYKIGDRVPVALVGCTLPGDFTIKAAKLRGVESQGMMCAPDEIGMGGTHEGLLLLPVGTAIGKKVHEILGHDTIFEVKATPNRADALSHLGVARDLAGRWGLPLKHAAAPAILAQGSLKITVENTADCPHYRGIIIRGVKVGSSPAWLVAHLQSAGVRSINNIVDVTNYICLGLGQPLHAFDLKKVSGDITVRRARAGEKITTLDKKERALTPEMLVIADAQKPLAIAGIMGGANSEVDATTTDILLEAAQFHPTLIRRAARALQLTSDSTYRFERGLDPLNVQPAAELAVKMILEIAGGKIEGATFAGQPPHTPKQFLVSAGFVVSQLGFDMSASAIEKALQAFGFSLSEKSTGVWEVTVPSYRLDVEQAVDVVEEVLRYYGVDCIPASPVQIVANSSHSDPLYTLTQGLSARLVALGYNECLHYTLRTRAEAERFAGAGVALHTLANPLSAEMSALRYSLIPGLVEALELNRSRGNALAPLFELGHIFRVVEGKLTEMCALSFVQTISPQGDTWNKNTPASDFFAAKALVESLVAAAGVAQPQWSRIDAHALFQPLHSAQFVAPQLWAAAGVVNFDITKAAGFAGTVLAGEIIFPLSFTPGTQSKRYQTWGAFPGTRRDVALIVAEDKPAGEVLNEVKKVATASVANKFKLSETVIFDLYRGAGIPQGHKSLALALHFRADDRTLTDDEVGVVFGEILTKLKTSGYQIRS